MSETIQQIKERAHRKLIARPQFDPDDPRPAVKNAKANISEAKERAHKKLSTRPQMK
jgi:hypothetical protein